MSTFFLCLFSALLLVFSFPVFKLTGFAWFAFVPLFIAIDGKKMRKAVIFSCLTGFVFFLGTVYWIGYVSVWGLTILVLYLTLYFGVFGLFVSCLSSGFWFLLLVPCFWVALEYIRSHLFSGFGWAALGYSQYLNIPLIQIADITGVYGVSFLVMMVNVSIFQILQAAGRRPQAAGRKFQTARTDFKSLLINIGIVSLILIAVFGYGKSQLLKRPEPKIKIAVVQGNISQQEKWDPQLKQLILDKYRVLTKLASFNQPDIIVWPETAVPGYLVNDDRLLDYITDLVKEVNKPLLLGSAFLANNQEVYNSAFLISRQGEVVGRYDKLHLVPFGEYIPLGKVFSFVKGVDKRAGGGNFTAGKTYTLFQLPITGCQLARFGVLICFEDVFPGLTRAFVRQGADFMVNITNDAWFGNSSGPYQHVQTSVLRAVENKKGVVRCANTGISCFIDPTGRITNKVLDKKGKDLSITGYLTGEISIWKILTFYTRFGDVFAYLCILISIGWGICFSLTKS
ncbi:MAG: apolipoprotein N-acyltransferase [Candidatus Omnitrophota bacterium]|nr:apolipoprotein N-acyltransferase [Candidatus Omnitrophota bacterium]